MIDLSFLPFNSLLFALLLVLAISLLSYVYKLNVVATMWLATIRSILQLLLLGHILFWLFEQNHPATLFVIALFMILIASHTVRQRMSHRYPGLFSRGFVSISLSLVFNGALMLLFILPHNPWYQLNKTVPLIGMLMGNSLNGITLGLDKFLNDLKNQSSSIEARLGLGASPYEAVAEIFQNSLKTGITPIINAMMIVGLVSIPGMMTGQILGGTDPKEAAFYQMMIMILILSATFFSVLLALYFSYRKLIANQNRLCREYLQ